MKPESQCQVTHIIITNGESERMKNCEGNMRPAICL